MSSYHFCKVLFLFFKRVNPFSPYIRSSDIEMKLVAIKSEFHLFSKTPLPCDEKKLWPFLKFV